MSTTSTSIEWTDCTWNPIRGCSRVSPGCVNCYAERMAARFGRSDMGPAEFTARSEAGDLPPFFGFAKQTPSGPRWTGKVELVESALLEPLRWRKPARVFVNSMSDLFHEALPDRSIDRVFAVMALCPHLTFQVLTKRAERMREYFQDVHYRAEMIGIDAEYISGLDRYMRGAEVEQVTGCADDVIARWRLPLPNVWLGVSVEDRARKDRIEALWRQTPAAVRFLSIEPLLEDIGTLDLDGIDWVIVGGESGPGARPIERGWVRSIRDQCQAASVAFFFKQWGDWYPLLSADEADNFPRSAKMDEEHQRIRVGKKRAGALLDGREWREFPA